MKTFKEFSEKEQLDEAMKIPKRFSSSTEATEFFDKAYEMLDSDAAYNWAKETGSSAVRQLNKVVSELGSFIDDLNEEF